MNGFYYIVAWLAFIQIAASARLDLASMFQHHTDLLTDQLIKKPAFSFKPCGSKTDPFLIKSMSLSPDPLKLPGPVSFSGDFDVKQNITGPLSVNVKMAKHVRSMRIDIPCVDGFGSCVYTDFCATMFALLGTKSCPDFFRSPSVPQGHYMFQNYKADVTSLPFKVPRGVYSFKAEFHSESIGHVGCAEVVVNIA